MVDKLKSLESGKVFEFFYEMNQIPRGSGNEKAISDWLADFAKKRNLEVKQDAYNNIIIRKGGTAGYEKADTVILQGHMDMVCEKEKDSPHDFLKDPIAFIVEGDTLRADKTTLGADDGIAVAMSLALLDADDIPHPPLEVLFTVAEETGMDGAIGLNPADIKGRTLVNIDSEEEGVFLTSCAGGKEVFFHLPIKWEDIAASKHFLKITVSGLIGGHSGMEIIKERGNANKLLARVLHAIGKKTQYNIAHIAGGSKHNAIPREAYAVIAVNASDEALVHDIVKAFDKIFKNEFAGIDNGVTVSVAADAGKVQRVFDASTSERIVELLLLTTHGVIAMSHSIEHLVQTSNNLAIVETLDNEVKVSCAIRSSIKSQKEAVADEFGIIGKLTGAKMVFDPGYPEWQYSPHSKIRDTFVEVYKKEFGKEPVISAIHAGLECGLFSEKFNGALDQISFGPNIYDVHTPKEHASISSIDRSWKFLKAVLKSLK